MNNLVVREYLGNGIEFKVVDGIVYANANKMAVGFGGNKKVENWKVSPNTIRYIDALGNSLKSRELKLIKSEEGKYGGTWIHEKLVLHFARYLNVEFELWCDEQIETLLRDGNVSVPKVQDSYMIEDPIERAKRWIEEQEQLQLAIKEKDMAIDMSNRVIEAVKVIAGNTANGYTISEVSKGMCVIGMGERNLFKYLREIGVLCQDKASWNEPTQMAINSRRAVSELKQTVVNGVDKIYTQTKITRKGVLWLYDRLIQTGYKSQVDRKEIEDLFI